MLPSTCCCPDASSRALMSLIVGGQLAGCPASEPARPHARALCPLLTRATVFFWGLGVLVFFPSKTSPPTYSPGPPPVFFIYGFRVKKNRQNCSPGPPPSPQRSGPGSGKPPPQRPGLQPQRRQRPLEPLRATAAGAATCGLRPQVTARGSGPCPVPGQGSPRRLSRDTIRQPITG